MLKRLIIRLIKCYQRNISPSIWSKCIYIPSCSEYTIDAVEEFGAFRGGFMGLWRILRCNPFAKGGLDPVKTRASRQISGD